MVLPSGFTFPVAYLAVLGAAALAVGYALSRADPVVDATTILAWGPWMAVGSTLYVASQLGLVGGVLAPAVTAPTVYLTTFVAAGVVWLATLRTPYPRRVFAGVGFLVLSVPISLALRYGATHGGLTLAWPLAGGVAACAVTAVVWVALDQLAPDATRVAGAAGALVVFGHTLDAATTAVGIDVLGFHEQTPLSDIVIQAGAAVVPGYGGWLFLLVKTLLAAGIVVLLAEYAREEPREGFLLYGLVAAVGLGPGAHNFLLFVVTTP